MSTFLAKSVLMLAISLAGMAGSCASRHLAHSALKQPATNAAGIGVDSSARPPVDLPLVSPTISQLISLSPLGAGLPPENPAGDQRKGSIWTQGLPSATVAALAAAASIIYFYRTLRLSRSVADRTVTFEAQKLLVEINKQFIADPSLFAIYDDNAENKKALDNDPKLKAKVAALGYMKLNVYEIVFSKLPNDSRDGAWKAYFLDSLDRCTVLGEELQGSRAIYHPKLIEAYDEWARDTQGRKSRSEARKQAGAVSKAAWIESPGGNDVKNAPQKAAPKEPGT